MKRLLVLLLLIGFVYSIEVELEMGDRFHQQLGNENVMIRYKVRDPQIPLRPARCKLYIDGSYNQSYRVKADDLKDWFHGVFYIPRIEYGIHTVNVTCVSDRVVGPPWNQSHPSDGEKKKFTWTIEDKRWYYALGFIGVFVLILSFRLIGLLQELHDKFKNPIIYGMWVLIWFLIVVTSMDLYNWFYYKFWYIYGLALLLSFGSLIMNMGDLFNYMRERGE